LVSSSNACVPEIQARGGDDEDGGRRTPEHLESVFRGLLSF